MTSRILHQYQQECRTVELPALTARRAHTGSVLTFLSPSPTHSRSAVEFLNKLFQLPRINTQETGRDSLDDLHFGSSSSSWDSIACACPTSGTILHFLSVSAEDEHKESTKSPHPALYLIAVHGSHSSSLSTQSSSFSQAIYHEALMECRRRLAGSIPLRQISDGASALSAIESRLRGMFLTIMCKVRGRYPNPSWILEKFPSTARPTPLLVDLTPLSSKHHDSPLKRNSNKDTRSKENDTQCKGEGNCCKIRELALPFFSGGMSLQATLSKSSLSRPLPGLYQCAVGPRGNKGKTKSNTHHEPGLIFRPLPAADEDFHLSPPSLVFQCNSLSASQKNIEGKLGGRTDRIGWRGHNQSGSLIVSHPSTFGLDIRICEGVGEEWALSSSFDESTESLLAASLSELQSTHVVSEGKANGSDASSVKEDARNLKGDCWVEFRETSKNPAVLFKQFSSWFNKPART